MTGLFEWDRDACTSNYADKSLKSFLPAHWQHIEKALKRLEWECLTSAETESSLTAGATMGRFAASAEWVRGDREDVELNTPSTGISPAQNLLTKFYHNNFWVDLRLTFIVTKY